MSNEKELDISSFDTKEELFDSKAEKELDSFLSDNALHDFLRIIREYPKATAEENQMLARKAQEGDANAREELINRNIRLVISRVLNLHYKLKSYEKIDLIQEGIISLMRAIDTYDETYSAFSSYAITWIDAKIRRAIQNGDNSIRLPIHFQVTLGKYMKLMEQNPNLKDEDICDILNITSNTLTSLRSSNYNPVSLSTPIDEEGDTELMDFVGAKDDSFSKLLDEDADREMLLFLKSVLSPRDYYIFYYRLVSDPKMTLEELGQELGVTRELIRQKETKITRKIKSYYMFGRNRRQTLKLDVFEQSHMDKLRIKPLKPDSIVRFLYLKDHLTDKEQEVYREMIFNKWEYSTSMFSHILDIEFGELREIENSIRRKEKEIIDENIKMYMFFKKLILRDHKTRIYDIDLDESIDKYTKSFEYLFNYWKDKSYDDFLKYFSKCNAKIPTELIENIKCFFGVETSDDYHRKYLERTLNKYVFEFDKLPEISNKKLLDALEEHRSEFSEKEYCILQYRLGKLPLKSIKKRYPDFKGSLSYGYLIEKLHRLYFGVKSYRQYNFTRKKYLKVRAKCIESMDPLYVKLLDEFYKDEKTTPHNELAKMFNMDIGTLKYIVRKAKLQAINIYLDKRYTIENEYVTYEEYLLWHDIDFTEPTKTIVEECIMLHHSYEEISQKLGLSTLQISNFLTDAIWKINFHRLGIYFPEIPYSKEFILDVLEKSNKFTEEEKKFLKYYLDVKSSRLVTEKFGVTKDNITTIVAKLYKMCRIEAVKDVEVSLEEIKVEIEKDTTEAVLTEKEKEYLELKYGIAGKYNPESLTLTDKQIQEHLNITKNQLYNLRFSIDKVKARKLGLIRNEFDFVDREEMEELLNDPHVPISSKERDLLIHIYGLYGKEKLSLEDFSKKYGETTRSLFRRLQRAYVMVKRYQMGEIQGNVNFELDIKPYLKFFSKSDQEILKSYYQDQKTVKEIALKYGFSLNIANNLLYKLRIYLKDLQDGEIRGLDFDYFWEVVYNRDLPFLGNKERAIDIFRLFYEERLNFNEILANYYPEQETIFSLRYKLESITFAVLKYKEGIRMPRNYSYEEIRSYYLAHQQKMSVPQKEKYYRYFKRRKEGNFSSRKLPLAIALDLASEDERYIHFDGSNREKVEEALTKYKDRIPKKNARAIARINGIHPRSTMNSHEIQQVLNFIAGIQYTPSKTLTLKN